jgi:hypothetical protein
MKKNKINKIRFKPLKQLENLKNPEHTTTNNGKITYENSYAKQLGVEEDLFNEVELNSELFYPENDIEWKIMMDEINEALGNTTYESKIEVAKKLSNL